MNDPDVNVFLEAVELLKGYPIDTAAGRSKFTVERYGQNVKYTPLSTGKEREQKNAWLNKLITKWKLTKSLKPSEYKETMHASYFLAVIREILQAGDQAGNSPADKIDVLRETVRRAAVDIRIGQQLFRKKLFHYWKGASAESIDKEAFLVASHIRPWSESTSSQRLDVFNGFLLSPNLDKLFELGLVSFDDEGRLLATSELAKMKLGTFQIDASIRLKKVDLKHREYLAYHRDERHKGMEYVPV